MKASENLRPLNRVFSHMPQDASEEYKQGWKEGCESGLSGMTNSFYQSFYTFKQDLHMLKNEVYYKSWKDSYDYCKGFAYGVIKEADMRRALPNAGGQFVRSGNSGGMKRLFENWGPSFLGRW